MSLLLDIGCGDTKLPGALGVDFHYSPSVDIVADIKFLPFREGAIDHIFSSYVIEHFGHNEVREVLLEWVRPLKNGGTFEIRCPNLRSRALLFVLFPSWNSIVNIYGEQNHSGNYHKSGFTNVLLIDLLKSVGIKDIKKIMERFKGIPFVPRCIHLIGTK